MKTTLFATCVLLLGSQALAQTPTGTSSTQQTPGGIGAAPVTLKFKPVNVNMNMDFSFMKGLSTWFLTRAHTIDLDGIVRQMKTDNIPQKNFVASFGVDGALVYHYELQGEKISDWNDIGRNAGGQLVPFSVQIMEGGISKVSFSAGSFRNMNLLQNSPHFIETSDYGSNGPANAWRAIDRLDIVTFTWDNHYTFNNLRTFDVDIVKMGVKMGLARNESNTTYLAVNAGGSVGTTQLKMDNAHDYGYNNNPTSGFKGTYTGGLEMNYQAKNNLRVNVQSNYYGGGGSSIHINNNSLALYNKQNEETYNASKAEYDASLQQWKDDKLAYEAANTNGVAISDESFAAISGAGKPGEPGKPETIDSDQRIGRSFGYVKNSVDVSYPLKRKNGRPMRIGVGLDVNFVIFDRLKNSTDTQGHSLAAPIIDLSGNYNQVVRGRIYLKF